MVGRKQQQKGVQCGDPLAFANELSTFYARFDVNNFKNECEDLCKTILLSPVAVDEREVVTCLSRVNPRKAPGPDGLGEHACKDIKRVCQSVGFLIY